MKNLPTNCTDVREKLPLYIGGDLEAESMELVRRHLAHCGGCATEAGAAEAARGVLVATLDREAPRESALWQEIRSTLVAEGRIPASLGAGEVVKEASLPTSPTITRPRLRLVRRATGLAAAAAVLAAAFTFGPKFFGSNETPVDETPAGPRFVAENAVTPLGESTNDERGLRPGEVPLSRTFAPTLHYQSEPMRVANGSETAPASGMPSEGSLASNPGTDVQGDGVRIIDGKPRIRR